jgi:cell division protein FtsI (penicillin-binding protein 3)
VLGKKTSSYFENELRKARANKNRYYLIGRKLGYTYFKIKGFPLFNLGVKVDIIEQELLGASGKIAERTVGYERTQITVNLLDGKGIEWAFRKYLNGKDGKILNKKLQKDSGNLFVMLMKLILKTVMM